MGKTASQSAKSAESGQGTNQSTEIEKFNQLAGNWWDPHGPMAPLHWMTGPRLSFIYEHLTTAGVKKNAKGLDLGCGAGLLTEPMARYGFSITGLDGAVEAIGVAQARARAEGLAVDYRVGLSDSVTDTYDFVTALEIIEHVDNPAAFVQQVADAVKPGGLIFLSTLNRTLQSKLIAVWGAEYILRALPIGTHDWQKFIKPSELVAMLEAAGCELVALDGLAFNPLQRSFRRDPRRLEINYILAARKKR